MKRVLTVAVVVLMCGGSAPDGGQSRPDAGSKPSSAAQRRLEDCMRAVPDREGLLDQCAACRCLEEIDPSGARSCMEAWRCVGSFRPATAP